MNVKIIKQQNISHKCIICGIYNDASMQTQFIETEEGVLIGIPKVQERHQSYPNRMHGGMISALLDEVTGRAVQITEPDTWAVTACLKTRYIKPVPLDSPIYVTGIITRNVSRLFEGEGKIYLAATGELLASATAKYIKLPVSQIASADFLHTQWIEETRPVPDLKAFAAPKQ